MPQFSGLEIVEECRGCRRSRRELLQSGEALVTGGVDHGLCRACARAAEAEREAARRVERYHLVTTETERPIAAKNRRRFVLHRMSRPGEGRRRTRTRII